MSARNGIFPLVPDRLDDVTPVAGDLLGRVDAVLGQIGAPPGHAVWEPLRKLRALPGETVAFFGDVQPSSLLAAAEQLRRVGTLYQGELHGDLSRAASGLRWDGDGYEAFNLHWQRMMGHLADPSGDGATPNMAGKLAATAAFVTSYAGWISTVRAELTSTLVTVISSAEAVLIKTSDAISPAANMQQAFAAGQLSSTAVRAAADIGRMVLEPVVRLYDTAVSVFLEPRAGMVSWSTRLGELAYTPPRSDGTMEGQEKEMSVQLY